MRANLAVAAAIVVLAASAPRAQHTSPEKGLEAFETVKAVFQHPRCQNCHIPEDRPRAMDDSRVHGMNVVRGKDGSGAPGLGCVTCHGVANPPASLGPNTPPGAPSWKLPPPEHKMVFIGLSSGALCRQLKDPKQSGGKDLKALTEHVGHDKLVLWGWSPGEGRKPVNIPHDQFMAAWNTWLAAGAPCAP